MDSNKLGNTTQNQAATASMYNHQMGFEPVVPLQATDNRWDWKTFQANGDSPEMVECKVKGLLNKLTMENFDSIYDQITLWANKSLNEKDGMTLIQVLKLVFEKATPRRMRPPHPCSCPNFCLPPACFPPWIGTIPIKCCPQQIP
jgi:hypothetical protein